jgi:glycosyltransferase involved in cell wall biosynthesis
MRVLLVNISLDAKLGGGTAERTRHLALSLAKADCQCEVFAITGNSWADEFSRNSIGAYITRAIGTRFPIPLVNPIRAWKATRQADVVHIMGYWNLLSVFMSAMAKLTGTPYILCPAGEFASIGRPRPIMRMFHVLVGRRMIRWAAGYIAITELERSVIATVAGDTGANIEVIPNAVSRPPAGAIDERLRQKLPSRPYILFMGRLAPVKGPDFLIQAYIDTPQAHAYDLLMAGPDFGMQAQLEAQLAHSPVMENVHFLGHLNEQERNQAYEGALMLVIPSRSEAMSLVALEAGILGIPVLLTDTCGFDQIEEIGGGLVVPATATGIATGLVAMLSDQTELALKGKRLGQYVADHYSWSHMASRLTDWLRKIIASA